LKLTDKFTIERGSAYMTGIQALVRLPLDQMRLDRRAGLNTGAFISGYEGSPLGGYDFALQRVAPLLAGHGIVFRPGLNEDLAATAIYGTQIFQSAGDPTVDGVVGIWYGKGPGVDRSGDIFRHANLTGSPGLCAALVLAGDDHPCKSSSIPHQSDFSLYNANIPILFPGNTQEILDYGLYAIALSRASGAWVSLKLLTQTCDGGGTVTLDPGRYSFRPLTGYEKVSDPRLVPGIANKLEYETNVRRIAAVLEFAALNPVNRLSGATGNARLGIATAGKYYYDLLQTLADFGIDEAGLERLGIRIAKFGLTYPLEPRFLDRFARGLETILVVEEKRSFLELQIREALYGSPHRPLILGKRDAGGAPLFRADHELDPDEIARAAGPILLGLADLPQVRERLASLESLSARPPELTVLRKPMYCPGCPHNRSTLVFEGQLAGGCIGCAGMGFLLDGSRGYAFAAHMGSEGAPWTGIAPFTRRKHMFQNIGDGTYFHSGSLAVQAAVAAGVNITYRILYNGHVAMTGGQDAVGAIPIPALTRKLEAEGVRRVVILAEDPSKYDDPGALGAQTEVRDRSQLESTMRELEREPGVTAIVYDQECAAEKRRARSRGKYQEPSRRLFIHKRVCEGCGDCVVQSNCMALQPVATSFGPKMSIHQASCNKDYSCALGDCPAFLSVEITPGTGLKKRPTPELPVERIPEPARLAGLDEPYRILAPGIGGTGVVTINALLAHAASIDGLHCTTLDQTGLAQKGGAVVSHLVLSRDPVNLSVKINSGNARVILGFDLLGVMNPENFKCAHPERTVAVLNTGLTPTSETLRGKASLGTAGERIVRIESVTRRGHNVHLDATALSQLLFGTHMLANILLLGAAWQAGLIPITRASLETAIELNGVDVRRNLQAFHYGRLYYVDAARVEAIAGLKPDEPPPPDYRAELTSYQNAAYAEQHAGFVESVRARRPELAPIVAANLFKLMAYKDEYEVARLLTSPATRREIEDAFESVESISFHLHPPLLRRFGLKRKITLGPWAAPFLKLLAALKPLRGGPLDFFGYAAHRRLERSLIGWYRDLVEIAVGLDDLGHARELCDLPARIRGYEAIKEASIAAARAVPLATRV
jgi:indolepyruvate ferredoxin oxidoreductase